MAQRNFHLQAEGEIHQAIVKKCRWSDTSQSFKEILKQTANQLPLLISFSNDSRREKQTILFFDRTVSKKILLSPLQPMEDSSNSFEIYPKHCSFAITELFKGIFEFVRGGQKRSRVFSNLETLTDFATKNKILTIFMSRDGIKGFQLDSGGTRWTPKTYPQGSIFQAMLIHRSKPSSENDHLECSDEDNVKVYFNMKQTGRFSLIATSIDQYENHRDTFLFSTQTPHICRLIKRLTKSTKSTITDCIRLVRGPVPENFHCQYLEFVRQHTHDILVGLTQQGLVVEWNLESEASCRYATNLNEILTKLSESHEEQMLEAYIDQARTIYRESFQFNMQLVSTHDWAAFFQFWKWTGQYIDEKNDERDIPYQSRQRFHLVASLQVDFLFHFVFERYFSSCSRLGSC